MHYFGIAGILVMLVFWILIWPISHNSHDWEWEHSELLGVLGGAARARPGAEANPIAMQMKSSNHDMEIHIHFCS
jgi:hypothetical protein